MDDVTPISTPSRNGVAQRPTGGLLNREKTAFRRDTRRLGAPWSKHVRCPKALSLSMLLRLQQTTAKELLANNLIEPVAFHGKNRTTPPQLEHTLLVKLFVDGS
jgi:hypothetical protein